MTEAGKLPQPLGFGRPDRRLDGLTERPAPTEEQKDAPTGRDKMLLRREAAWREMTRVLGAVMANATALQVPGRGLLGPARDRRGKILRWSYWSPSRMLLIDRFKRVMPPEDELEDRRDFAGANGILYAVVGPGAALTAGEVREMLEEEAKA